MNNNSVLQGITDSIPIGLSFLLFGGIFGVMALQVGMTPLESVLMSWFVHAGSAQFAVLPMLSNEANFWSMVLVTFLMNSRYLLMGMSLAPHYASHPKWMANVTAFFMSDEQYALTFNHMSRNGFDKTYILVVSLFLHGLWSLGTWIGTIAGNWISNPQALGLEFSFTAMFLALAFSELRTPKRIILFLTCGVTAIVLSLWSTNGLHVLGAGALAFVVGFLSPTTLKDQIQANHKQQGGETA